MRFYLILFFIYTYSLFSQEFKIINKNDNYYLFTTENNEGIYFYDSKNNETYLLCKTIGSGFRASFSKDKKFIGFKFIELKNNYSYQTPVLFDIQNKIFIKLAAISSQAGVPTFTENGAICYTTGKNLFFLDSNFNQKFSLNLDNYVNLPAISPDGKKLILNDHNDRLYYVDVDQIAGSGIHELNLKNNSSFINYISEVKSFCHSPLWSDDSKKISYSTLNSDCIIFNLENKSSLNLGKAQNQKWINNKFTYEKLNFDSDANLISKENLIYDINSNTLKKSDPGNTNFIFNKSVIDLSNGLSSNIQIINSNDLKIQDLIITRFDSVYFHQVYDCPEIRAGLGDGCCGAASSLMGLMFYNILPERGIRSVNPYKNYYSPYGTYLSEIYTFKDVTYNYSNTRSNGTTGWGIYGWIYRNNLEDTKGYMASMLRNHGLNSSVDWEPSWEKVKTEIDNGNPFVLLNSLTSAGHYIVWTGYVNENMTGVFNDPYGNKNYSPYMRYYNTNRVKYDWPGYNNGYANLTTVWCFIYMRKGADLVLTSTEVTKINPENKISYEAKIKNYGTLDVKSNYSLKVYLSNDTKIDGNDSLLAKSVLDPLSIGDSISQKFELTLPKLNITKCFNLISKVDADNEITENDKNNNIKINAVSIYGKPNVTLLYPYPNSTTTNTIIPIYVTFDADQLIDTSLIKLKINGTDITSKLKKWDYKIIYYPELPYESNQINAEVFLKNKFGYDSTFKWTFFVNSQTKVDQIENIKEFKLYQNYPNPFNSSTNIKFNLVTSSNVKIVIFDLLGRELKTLINDFYINGEYNISFNANEFPTGSYIYEIRTNKIIQRKILTLIK